MDKQIESNWLRTIKKSDISNTPAFIISQKIIRNNVKRFKKALPRVKVYYAVKALSDECVLKAVDDLVDGYDIASLGELKIVRSVSKKPLVFSNPVKIPQHIQKSYEHGVTKFAFDSVMELDKIAQYAPGSDVYLRLKVSDYGSAFPLSKKFGADESHAVALFGHAVDLGLNPIGLTFHVGSQSENTRTWESAIEKAGNVLERLRKAGFNANFLDIGGGFPGQYTDQTITIEEVAKVINESLDKYIDKDVSICAEPGRYIVADAAVLVTTIIGKENRSGQNWLYLDVGVFQGLMESLEMEDWKYPIFTLSEMNTKAMPQHFVLTGPTCDAYDTIDLDVPLPANISVGDQICIGSIGAYSIVYGSNFNGFDVPTIVCVNTSDKDSAK